MKKEYILVGNWVLAIMIVMSGCGSGGKDTQSQSAKDLQELYNDTQGLIDKFDQGIAMPEGLLACDSKYFQKTESQTMGCETYPDEPVCSYYTLNKNGEVKLKSLQYNNECYACRFYGESGVKKSGDMVYKNLGLLKGECVQGMYQK